MRSSGLAARIAAAAIPLVLLAGVVTLLITPVYRSSATVAVDPKGDLDSTQVKDFLDRQVDSVVSDESLKIAGEKLELTPSEARELKQSLSVRVLPDSEVLRITVSASQARQAGDWANGVALTFVQVANSQSSKDNLAAADQLRTRISGLSKQVADLDVRLSQNPVDRARLTAERDARNREIGAVQTQLNELSPAQAENQAKLLRAASEPSRPIRPKPGQNLLLGALVGAAIGALRHKKAKGKASPMELDSLKESSPAPQPVPAEPEYLRSLNSLSRHVDVDRGGTEKLDRNEDLFSLEARFAGVLQKVVAGIQDQMRADREHFAQALLASRDGAQGDESRLLSLETRFTGALQNVVTGIQDQLKADRERLTQTLIESRDELKSAESRLLGLETKFAGALQNVVTGIQDQLKADRERLTQTLIESRDELKSAESRLLGLETKFAGALQNVVTGIQDQLKADRERLTQTLIESRDELKSAESRLLGLETKFAGALQNVVTGLEDRLKADREQFSKELALSGGEMAGAESRELELASKQQHLAILDALVSNKVSLLASKVGTALFNTQEAVSSRLEDNERYLSMILKSVESRMDGAVFEIGERLGKAGLDLSSHLNGTDFAFESALRKAEEDRTSLHRRLETIDGEMAARLGERVESILEAAQKDAQSRSTKRDLQLNKRLARIEQIISAADDGPTKKSAARPRRPSRAKPSKSGRAAKPTRSGKPPSNSS